MRRCWQGSYRVYVLTSGNSRKGSVTRLTIAGGDCRLLYIGTGRQSPHHHDDHNDDGEDNNDDDDDFVDAARATVTDL